MNSPSVLKLTDQEVVVTFPADLNTNVILARKPMRTVSATGEKILKSKGKKNEKVQNCRSFKFCRFSSTA